MASEMCIRDSVPCHKDFSAGEVGIEVTVRLHESMNDFMEAYLESNYLSLIHI